MAVLAGADVDLDDVRSSAEANLMWVALDTLAKRNYAVGAMIDWNGHFPGEQVAKGIVIGLLVITVVALIAIAVSKSSHGHGHGGGGHASSGGHGGGTAGGGATHAAPASCTPRTTDPREGARPDGLPPAQQKLLGSSPWPDFEPTAYHKTTKSQSRASRLTFTRLCIT